MRLTGRWNTVALGLLLSCGSPSRDGGPTSPGAANTTAPAAARIALTPSSPSVVLWQYTQLAASAYDATGAPIVGRAMQFTSGDTTKVRVTSGGMLSAWGVGATTVTVALDTAKLTVPVTVVLNSSPIETGIHNPDSLLATCPSRDPAYGQIRGDFEFLVDSRPSPATLECIEPFTSMKDAQMSFEIAILQALRFARNMNEGTAARLPWTRYGLYDWMHSQVAGISFEATAGSWACCRTLNGLRYIIAPHPTSGLSRYTDPILQLAFLVTLAHEARHVLGPLHTTGCPAFPLPTDALGCDATYDLSALGSNGVHYWLLSSLATGYLKIGIACLSASRANAWVTFATVNANSRATQITANAPPMVVVSPPYGGLCTS
jgi:hypothetical protein